MPAYGRGGAGNIEAATSISRTNSPSNLDLEKNAQKSSTSAAAAAAAAATDDYLESRTHLASYAGAATDSLHNQQYAHMGRGGAGNYYSPWELQMRGEFTGAGTSHVLGDGTPQPLSQVTERQGDKSSGGAGAESIPVQKDVYRGRGGAGNFAYGVSESEERAWRRKHEEEERKKEEVRRLAEKSVEEGLARPEKAKVTDGEKLVF